MSPTPAERRRALATTVPGAHDLRADLLADLKADLSGPVELPGAEALPPPAAPVPAPPAPPGPPALEVRITPTTWSLARRGLGLQVGPVSVALTRR